MDKQDVIKKDQGINLLSLTNCEKAIIINALRDRYILKDLPKVLCMAKSSYCYQFTAMSNDKYADLRADIKDIFDQARKCLVTAGSIQ
jgi:putative transposase